MTKKREIIINKKEQEELQNHIDSVRQELAHYPYGSLKIHRKKNSSFVFYTVQKVNSSNRREKYISPSDKAFPRYAQKRYLSNLLEVLENDLISLNNGYCINQQARIKVYTSLPAELKPHVTPIFKPMSLICKEWDAQTYEPCNYPFDPHSIYITKKGEKVRSKNECIVADRLYDAGIPYKYEAPIRLSNGSIVYPDFTIKNPRTGHIFFLEIMGMMDLPNYIENNLRKFHDYPLEPWYRDLFYLFAHKDMPFDTAAVDALINNYFL